MYIVTKCELIFFKQVFLSFSESVLIDWQQWPMNHQTIRMCGFCISFAQTSPTQEITFKPFCWGHYFLLFYFPSNRRWLLWGQNLLLNSSWFWFSYILLYNLSALWILGLNLTCQSDCCKSFIFHIGINNILLLNILSLHPQPAWDHLDQPKQTAPFKYVHSINLDSNIRGMSMTSFIILLFIHNT